MVWTAPPGHDLNANLVVLHAGESIPSHVNDALDVLLVVIAGAGYVEVDDERVHVRAHTALLIPKGAARGVEPAAGPDGIRYLTVHVARPPLQIGTRR